MSLTSENRFLKEGNLTWLSLCRVPSWTVQTLHSEQPLEWVTESGGKKYPRNVQLCNKYEKYIYCTKIFRAPISELNMLK